MAYDTHMGRVRFFFLFAIVSRKALVSTERVPGKEEEEIDDDDDDNEPYVSPQFLIYFSLSV
jgi:hypothetical protein